MSIKSLNIPSYEPTKEELQINHIFWVLNNMGHGCEDEREIVDCIKKNKLDISQLEFPGGSFEKFEQDVAAGKYDRNYSHMMTDEEMKQVEKDIASGKLYTIY